MRVLRAVVVMGVAGSGKTSVGRALGARLGWDFFDGDDFHGASNRRTMASGVPLTDEDRWPWLDALAALLRERLGRGEPTVLACSALRRAYRERLGLDDPRIATLHLTGDAETIGARLRERRGHYMPATLLESQLATLEPPLEAVTVDVAADLGAVVDECVAGLDALDAARSGAWPEPPHDDGTRGRP